MSFPGLVANVPIELAEHLAPIRILSKQLSPGSGGTGKQRGGLGQEVVIESTARTPMRVSIQADRIRTAASGLLGGGAGSRGEVLVNDRPVADVKGMVTLERGDRIVLRMPGGGGFGNALERDPAAVLRDIAMGYVRRGRP